ncbi:MAG: SDR family NAD(P)-dependent oxidoreductase [Kineosporiaceae bacterium]
MAVLGRSREGLHPAVAAIEGAGRRAVAVVADVRDEEAVAAAVARAAAALGGVDLLVNNAGVIESDEVPVWEADAREWWDVVETDLRGPFHLVRHVVPGMLVRGGGRVVDLSSGAGANDRDVYSAYCAAKAGLIRLGAHLHLAGYARGLRSFEIAPGVVSTDMTRSMAMHDGREDWTDPEEFVSLVVAAAQGRLDAWSGCFMRAGLDSVDELVARAAALADETGAVPYPSRRLLVHPFAPEDPLSPLRQV